MNKLLNMLGLAKRAGKISTGSFICDIMQVIRWFFYSISSFRPNEKTKFKKVGKFFMIYITGDMHGEEERLYEKPLRK